MFNSKIGWKTFFFKTKILLHWFLVFFKIEDFILSRMTGATKARAHAGEISFVLPKEKTAAFPALFTELDQHLAELKVRNYGISLATMEEIFLTLADEDTDLNGKSSATSDNSRTTKKQDYAELAKTTFSRPVKGSVSVWRKFVELAKIRLFLLFRSKLFVVLGIVVPFVMVLLNGILTVLKVGDFDPFAWQDTTPLNIGGLATDFRSNAAGFYSNKTGIWLCRFTGQVSGEILIHPIRPFQKHREIEAERTY